MEGDRRKGLRYYQGQSHGSETYRLRRAAGLELGTVNLRRLTIPEKNKKGIVSWGLREVLPLLEIRVPFEPDQMELDCVSRGTKNADLGPMEKAALAVAMRIKSILLISKLKQLMMAFLFDSERKLSSFSACIERFPSSLQ